MEAVGNIYTIITEMRNDFQNIKPKLQGVIILLWYVSSFLAMSTPGLSASFSEVSPCGSPTESTPVQQVATTCRWSFRFAPEHTSGRRNYLSNTNYHTARLPVLYLQIAK